MTAAQTDATETLKYPIGKYQRPENVTSEMIADYIADLGTIPIRLATAITELSDQQLNTTYRPDGWTIRQVAHHMADSHLNAFVRFKLTLTEEVPTIKPYMEARWAETSDGKLMPVDPSIRLLEGIHQRWIYLLRSMTKDEFSRKYFHPETKVEGRLDQFLSLYAWHGNHHLAHITELKRRMHWN